MSRLTRKAKGRVDGSLQYGFEGFFWKNLSREKKEVFGKGQGMGFSH
jgi:hypothetical protein